MDIEILDSPFEEVKTIHHAADIHIRNLKRHDEYIEVFKKFWKQLEENPGENPICVIVGDIAHSKTEMSPELIDMISLFLKKCASYMPTFLIPGNHDANLSNMNRQDALSPILRNIDDPNLHYFKKSGVYQFANINFVHWSQFDDPENYISADQLPDDGRNSIALYHAPVDKSVTDYGFVMNNDKINADDFKGFDLALLGDIHKHQFLDEDLTICYPGSLIMQNHGEYLSNHGYVKWDLDSKEYEFIQIDNDYEFFTIEVDEGRIPEIKNVPEKPRLRVQFKNTPSTQINDLIYEIRKKYTPSELRQNRIYEEREDVDSEEGPEKLDIGNVKSVEFQNELIRDYLKKNTDIEEDVLDRVCEINEEINEKVKLDEFAKNVKWRPIRFEFDNMFTYGEGNVIEFDTKNGAVGIFGPNACGKSSILSALTFCIFDKCHRAYKAGDVMNNDSDTFRCKLEFEIDGNVYVIERNGSERKYRNATKVEVEFWTYDENGEKVNLSGEQRYDTNAIIRNYLGEYEDFVLTTLSLQNNNTIFIEMSQAERKDLLERFMGLNIFNRLESEGSDKSREIYSILKDLRKKDFTKQLADIELKIEEHKKEYKELKEDRRKKRKEVNQLRQDVVSKTKELKDIGDINTNIDSLEESKKRKKRKIKTLNDKIEKAVSKQEELIPQINEKQDQLTAFDIDELEHQETIAESKRDEKQQTKNKINVLKNEIRNKQELVDHLDDHEYDPDCKYCVQNKFVQKATKAKDELPSLKEKLSGLKEQRDELQSEIEEFAEIEEQISEYYDIKNALEKLKNEKHSLELRIENNEVKLENAKSALKNIKNEIEDYYSHLDDIKHNEKIQEEIDELEAELKQEENNLEALDNKVQNVHSNIKVEERDRERIQEDIEREKELESKYVAYGHYLDSVKRDGVPYSLISKAIPTIEEEVNNILAQIVDFGIILDVDGKNINTKIVFDENRMWPLEMASGMEKFISSLAIRTALINVSTIPRPNFIAIDEGFGNLDSDNLNSMFMLFDYLKTQFDFLMIISHLESMRDVVDQIIEVQKNKNTSNVNA